MLSSKITGNPLKIRKNFTPKQYKENIKEFIKGVDQLAEKHLK